MKPTTQALTLSDQFKSALTLVERAHSVITISTAEEYRNAETDWKALIQQEKVLEEQYAALQCVIDAKQAQAQKKDLAAKFDGAKKFLRNGAMLRYEQAEEAKRQAEQRRLAKIAQDKADEEARAAAAIAQAEAKKAAAEAARLAKKGDEEAAEQARNRAEMARQEAERIKADAASAPAAVVIVERSTPAVARRTIWKFEITDQTLLPREFLKPDEVAIGSVVRGLKAAAKIPGVRTWEETV